MPPAYKEQPPADFKEAQGWKPGQPADGRLKGKWWEIYNDPELNALEEKVSINNQNVLVAEAQYREARDAVRIARAALVPHRPRLRPPSPNRAPPVSTGRSGDAPCTTSPSTSRIRRTCGAPSAAT